MGRMSSRPYSSTERSAPDRRWWPWMRRSVRSRDICLAQERTVALQLCAPYKRNSCGGGAEECWRQCADRSERSRGTARRRGQGSSKKGRGSEPPKTAGRKSMTRSGWRDRVSDRAAGQEETKGHGADGGLGPQSCAKDGRVGKLEVEARRRHPQDITPPQ